MYLHLLQGGDLVRDGWNVSHGNLILVGLGNLNLKVLGSVGEEVEPGVGRVRDSVGEFVLGETQDLGFVVEL